MTMRNNSTRLRIASPDRRRFRAVVARQGQVPLDADFDHQSKHQLERVEIETLDSLGSPGRLVFPAGGTGFKVNPAATPATFDIQPGRGYLDGWLLENTAACKLTTQPHPRVGDGVAVTTVIALKSLVRLIDPVEDSILADVALGDAVAAGRTRNDWQVFPFAIAGTPTCATLATDAQWQKMIAPSTGRLAVDVQSSAPPTDPCSLNPAGGYSRLENLLYRVEVDGGTTDMSYPIIDGPRFQLNGLKLKFSRRNASVLVRITGVTPTELTVTPPVLDPRNWFAPGTYAEIVSLDDDLDPRAALANNRLFKVANAYDDKVILEATGTQINDTGANATNGRWFLRLWDSFPGAAAPGQVTVVTGGGTTSQAIDLGDGLSMTLSSGVFRRGDYWTFAARADGSVDWPRTLNIPDTMTPHGPEVRYAPLAVYGGLAAPAFEDCRIPFATLTDRALLYRGGDGQSVFAPAAGGLVPLPAKLRVAVMRGETPVLGASVLWSYVGPPGGSCQINGVAVSAATPFGPVDTDGNGLVEVAWSINAGQPFATHQVQAVIIDANGTTSRPPVIFSATFRTAQETSYTPNGCKHLIGVDNVQEALDTLCEKIEETRPTLQLIRIRVVGLPATGPIDLLEQEKNVILNGEEFPADRLIGGLEFSFDQGPLGCTPTDYDPIVEVEVDLPYATTDFDKLYWAAASGIDRSHNVPDTLSAPFGFQRVRLDGRVEIGKKDEEPGLTWTPSDQAAKFLQRSYLHQFGERTALVQGDLKQAGWVGPKKPISRVLCRIRLRSAHIWTVDKKTKETIYLNAEHLGTRAPLTRRELVWPTVDPQWAADLDLFVYLQPTIRPPQTVTANWEATDIRFTRARTITPPR